MTSSTSLIISGSSAEVGSSKSMIFGCMASARAMATRCCWPPDRLAGIRAGLVGDAHPRQQLARGLLRLRPREALDLHRRQHDVLERRHVREEIEGLEHHADLGAQPRRGSTRGAVMDSPWTQDLALLDRLQPVDAADERALARARGPHTTMTSPASTSRLTSARTWSGPNHLSTLLNSMAWATASGRYSITTRTSPGIDGLAGLDADLHDRPRRRRAKLVLHLHGLEHDEPVARPRRPARPRPRRARPCPAWAPSAPGRPRPPCRRACG